MAEGGVDPDVLSMLEIPMISVEDTSDCDSEADTKAHRTSPVAADHVLPSSDPQRSLLAASLSPSNSSTELMATSPLMRSNSILPAWKRNIEIVRMTAPPSPKKKRSTTMSGVVSSIWNKFQTPKIALVGVGPSDAECDSEHVPIVYNKQYDIRGRRSIGLPKQTVLFNKSARVFSKLVKGKMLLKFKHFDGVADIATQYDLFNLLSDPIREREIEKILEIMNMKKPSRPTHWDNVDELLLTPLRVQSMGSVIACKLAIDEGWAINIGGGFGHHTTNTGGGLAVYDDVLFCLSILSNFSQIHQILVINVDAYQSPCYKYAKNIGCPITIIDFYSEPIQESHGYNNRITKEIYYNGYQLSAQEMASNSYLSLCNKVIKQHLAKQELEPSLCIYIAGTTVLQSNPHTAMKFTIQDVVTRDSMIVRLIRHYNIPIAFLLGGSCQCYDVKAASASILGLWKRELLRKL